MRSVYTLGYNFVVAGMFFEFLDFEKQFRAEAALKWKVLVDLDACGLIAIGVSNFITNF